MKRLPPDRPHIPDYGIPEELAGMIPWERVSEILAAARFYWVASARPDARPHAVPVWGVWLDEVLYFGGGPDTRHARNLLLNPAVVIHCERGDEIVILEGKAVKIASDDLQMRVDDEYKVKYNLRHGPTIWEVKPRVAFAWDEAHYPHSATRWRYAAD